MLQIKNHLTQKCLTQKSHIPKIQSYHFLFFHSIIYYLHFRIQTYERDLKRWEYMEEEAQRNNQKIETLKTKYPLANANKGGAAFNILNLEYDQSKEGEYLRIRDQERDIRNALRSKNVDGLSNNNYNVLNGEMRRQIDVPQHDFYNPNPSKPASRGS